MGLHHPISVACIVMNIQAQRLNHAFAAARASHFKILNEKAEGHLYLPTGAGHFSDE
jgi:hypothetical protein